VLHLVGEADHRAAPPSDRKVATVFQMIAVSGHVALDFNRG